MSKKRKSFFDSEDNMEQSTELTESEKKAEIKQWEYIVHDIKSRRKSSLLPSKLEAIILRKVNDSYIKIGDVGIKNTDTAFRFLSGDKAVTFIVPENIKVCYYDGKKGYLFFDFDSGFISFEKNAMPLTIKEIDDLLTKNVIVGLFNRIKGSLEKTELSGTIFKYIIVAIASGAVAWIANDALAPAQMIGGILTSLI